MLAHDPDEFLMDDLDHRLPRGQALQYLLTLLFVHRVRNNIMAGANDIRAKLGLVAGDRPTEAPVEELEAAAVK